MATQRMIDYQGKILEGWISVAPGDRILAVLVNGWKFSSRGP